MLRTPPRSDAEERVPQVCCWLAGCDGRLCTCLYNRLPCSPIPIWLELLLLLTACCKLAAAATRLPTYLRLAADWLFGCQLSQLSPISVFWSVRLAGLARRLTELADARSHFPTLTTAGCCWLSLALAGRRAGSQ